MSYIIPSEIAMASYEQAMRNRLYAAIAKDAVLVEYVDGIYAREKHTAYFLMFLICVIILGVFYLEIVPQVGMMVGVP